MGKREIMQRERRAFRRGICVAMGMFCLSMACFFAVCSDVGFAAAGALSVMAAATFRA